MGKHWRGWVGILSLALMGTAMLLHREAKHAATRPPGRGPEVMKPEDPSVPEAASIAATASGATERLADEERSIRDMAVAGAGGRILLRDGAIHLNGAYYGASFDKLGLQFAPPEGRDGSKPRLRLLMREVRCGEERVAAGGPAMPRWDDATRQVSYRHGSVEERYELRAEDVEQYFVIERLPEKRGDLRVVVGVESNCAPPEARKPLHTLAFTQGDRTVFTISQAIAFDARGERVAMDMVYEDGAYAMTIPAEWVAQAALPITVDPLVGSPIFVDTNETYQRSDAAYSTTSGLWMVVWSERVGATSDYNIYYKRIMANGSQLDTGEGVTIDGTATACEYPSVAFLGSVNHFLVVWQETVSGAIRGRRIAAATGSTVGNVDIATTGVNRRPDVSGDVSTPANAPFWLVVWQEEAGASVTNVRGRTVSSGGTLGATTLTFDTSSVHARAPAVAWNHPLARYLVVWQESSSTGSGLIMGRTYSQSAGLGSVTTLTGISYREPDVCGGSSVGWLVAFELPTASPDIYCLRANSNGGVVSGSSQVIADSGSSENPKIGFSSTSNAWYVVYEQTTSTSGRDIRGRRISTSDVMTPAGATGDSVIALSGDQIAPAISARTNNTDDLLVLGINQAVPELRGARWNMTLTNPPTTISPASLPAATVGQAYSVTFTTDGSAPIVWTSSGWPSWATWSGGTVSGTPSSPGSFSVSVTATNTAGATSRSYTLTVNPVATPPTITTTSPLPQGDVGVPYSVTLQATPTTGITWSWAPTSSHPSWMTSWLNSSTGQLSGTPTAAGTFNLVVRATNTAGFDDQALSLTIRSVPVITSPANGATLTAGIVGEVYSVTFTASGVPAPSWAFSGGPGFPATAAAGNTRTVTFTPTTEGTFTVTVTATNSVGSDTNTYSWTVRRRPTITNPTPGSTLPPATEGVAYGPITFTATGTAPIAFSLNNAPAGLSINPSTGVLSGTPAVGSGGVYGVDVIVSNATGPQTFTYSLSVYFPPQITGPAALPDGTQGVAYPAVLFNANGLPAPTWTVANGPAGLNFAGSALTGTPTQVGAFTLTITATNAVGSDTTTITMQVFEPPAITGPPTIPAGSVGQAYGPITFTATGSPPLNWTAGGLPLGLTLDAATGVLSGTPGQAGTFTVTINVSNGSSVTDTATYTLAIGTTPPPPVAPTTIAPPSPLAPGTVGTPYSVTFTTDGSAPVVWALAPLPPGMAFDGATGVYSGTPTTPGTYNFTVTATNGAGALAQAYTHQHGTAPTITGPASPLPGAVVGAPYGPFSFTATGTGPIAWNATGLPPGLNLSALGVFNGTPTTAGTYTFPVSAQSPYGTDTDTYTMTIVLLAPVITGPPLPIANGTDDAAYGPITFQATGSLPITWSISGTAPPGLSINPSTGSYGGTPTTPGSYTFNVVAQNAAGSTPVSVTHVINDVPVSGITPASPLAAGTLGVPYSVTFGAAAGSTPITWSLGAGAPGGLSINPTTGVYSGTPSAVGTFTFNVIATNVSGTATTVSYTHVINGAAPTITGPASPLPGASVGTAYGPINFTATGSPVITWTLSGAPAGMVIDNSTGALTWPAPVLGTYSFNVIATNGLGPTSAPYSLTAYNPPNITGPATLANGSDGVAYGPVTFTATGSGPITWSLGAGAPPGMTINATTGAYGGTPTNDGAYTFDVIATGPGGTDTATLTHTIDPVLATITGPATLPAGADGVAYGPVTFTATGSTPITWSVSGQPAGMSINAASGALGGTPSGFGAFTLTVTATNAAGATSVLRGLTINPTGPTITGPASPLPIGVVGQAYAGVTFTATGSAPITWSMTGAPGGMALNASTGAYTGTPTGAGVFTVQVTATNVAGVATASFTHSIFEVPAITGPATIPDGTEGVGYGAVTFTATGTAPITWSLGAGAPPGITIDAATGAYGGTPTTAGTYTFDVTATNAGGSDTVSRTHTIIPVPPTITTPGDALPPGAPGVAYTPFQFTSSGTGPVTWSIVGGAPAGMSMTAGGLYQGTPVTPGVYTLTVEASNVAGPSTATFVHVITDRPAAPAQLGQFLLNGTTALLVGGTTTESAILLRAIVTDPDGDEVEARFEVKPTGTPLDGTGLVTGTRVSSGGTSWAIVPVSSNGTYHWQAFARDVVGATSAAGTAFGNNGAGATDFVRATAPINASPNQPAGLAQLNTNGVSTIGVGATTTEGFVIFRGQVSDPDGNAVALEVELKPVASDFDGTGTFQGSFVSSGSTGSVTIPVGSGSYHWRARAIDSIGATSSWISFGANADVPLPAATDFVASPAANAAPQNPVSLGQLRLNGVTSIAVGGSTNELGVVLRGTLIDPNPGNGVAIQVEVRPIGIPFSNSPSATGGFVGSGAIGTVTVTGLNPAAQYHWQARTVDFSGAASAWVAFGANSDDPLPADVDFAVAGANASPGVAGGAQFRSNGVTVLPAGGTTNESGVVLRATLSDSDSSTVRFEIEIIPSPGAYAGTPTVVTAPGAPGTFEIAVTGLVPGAYQWQYRAVDSGGAASAWSNFIGGAAFSVVANSAPAAPAAPQQRRLDGVTAIPLGGQTGQVAFRAFVAVNDPDALDTVRLEVEAKPAGSAFDGVSDISIGSWFANGTTADVQVSMLSLGWYHWRVRTRDAQGAASAWVPFAVVGPPDNHLERIPNQAPVLTAIDQYPANSSTAVPVGGIIPGGVRFMASITDAENDPVSLEVEAVKVGTPFSDSSTHASPYDIAPATVVAEAVLPQEGAYHWQYRIRDSSGNVSAWVPFGGNSDPDDADFTFNFGGNQNPREKSQKSCSLSVTAASGGTWILWAMMLAGALAAWRKRISR